MTCHNEFKQVMVRLRTMITVPQIEDYMYEDVLREIAMALTHPEKEDLNFFAMVVNELPDIPDEIIHELSGQIKRVNLGGNKLSSLPEWINKLPQLVELFINDNELTDDALSTIEANSNITSLDISGNQFTGNAIRHIADKFPNLQKLEAGDNTSIGDIPPDIEKLTELTSLCLLKCNIRSLPKEMSHLEKLKELFLRENPLSELQNIPDGVHVIWDVPIQRSKTDDM